MEKLMNAGLRICLVDPYSDYLGIEIHAWNKGFAGKAFIIAAHGELSEFAAVIAGFPAHLEDRRIYEFGSPDTRIAGGYCGLRLHTLDSAGHAAVEITLEDDGHWYATGPGMTKLRIPVEAASIDRFVQRLRLVEREQTGEAVLGA